MTVYPTIEHTGLDDKRSSHGVSHAVLLNNTKNQSNQTHIKYQLT